jgi:hypothetical protein
VKRASDRIARAPDWFALALSCCALAVAAFAQPAAAQETTETRELTGQIGRRQVVMSLYALKQADGAWRVTGEYLVLPSLQQRFLEGERSAQIGVTTLNEGMTPILYGRAPTAVFQGNWAGGTFKGTRLAPGGQEREHFDLSEVFPGMEQYSATVRCKASGERYSSSLAFVVEGGKLKAGSFDWRSRVAPGGHRCAIGGGERVAQGTLAGGLRFLAGKRCTVTLRDLGEYVRVLAEDCAEHCGSQAYLEPLFIERRGGACRLLRPQGG